MKFLFLLVLTVLPAHAVMLSAGSYVPYFNQAQTSNSGSQQTFAINPYFGIGTQLPITGLTYFMPEFGYAYYPNIASKLRKDTIFLHYNFAYVITDKFIARYGLTNHWYRLLGEGGNLSLNNGNSRLTFPAPDKTVTSHFTTLNVGAEYFFSAKKYSLRFDFEIMNPKQLDDRGYNYLLTVNIY